MRFQVVKHRDYTMIYDEVSAPNRFVAEAIVDGMRPTREFVSGDPITDYVYLLDPEFDHCHQNPARPQRRRDDPQRAADPDDVPRPAALTNPAYRDWLRARVRRGVGAATLARRYGLSRRKVAADLYRLRLSERYAK